MLEEIKEVDEAENAQYLIEFEIDYIDFEKYESFKQKKAQDNAYCNNGDAHEDGVRLNDVQGSNTSQRLDRHLDEDFETIAGDIEKGSYYFSFSLFFM